MSVEAAIREKLSVLQPQSLELSDESALHAGHVGAQGGGGHYRLRIVSPLFDGQSGVARHRMVYAALGPLMHREIHALALQAKAPGEQ
ncbi:MAG TPA: BolA family protein [Burkholderiales bacterium]|nr:BolA family protein [Burkholderiales bacterium]